MGEIACKRVRNELKLGLVCNRLVHAVGAEVGQLLGPFKLLLDVADAGADG